jgi:F-type H+-transporting ATPase subunit b
MVRKTSLLLLLAVLPLLVFMSAEEHPHHSDPMAFIAKVVNFVVLFGGLAYLLRKPISQFLNDRRVKIDTWIQDAKGSRQRAESDLEGAERRLNDLSQEVEMLKKEALSEGNREKERIISNSKEEGAKMKETARQEIELISRAGIRGLKAYAVSLAAEEALERITKGLTPERHARLIDDSIEKLEGLHEKSRSR